MEALLIIEVDGDPSQVDREAAQLQQLCQSLGARRIRRATSATEAEVLWQARKAISPALFRYAPDKINEDIVVPRSRIPDMVRRIDELRRETGSDHGKLRPCGRRQHSLQHHAGQKGSEGPGKSGSGGGKIFDATLAFGGTISGEHGVGVTKAPYLAKEIGRRELTLMKQIKKVFDPNGILNPGKIF